MQKSLYVSLFSFLIGTMCWASPDTPKSTVADNLIPGATPTVNPTQQTAPQVPEGYFVKGVVHDQSSIPCGLQVENQGDSVIIRAGEMGTNGAITEPHPEFKVDDLLWSMFKRYNSPLRVDSPNIPTDTSGWYTSAAIKSKDDVKEMQLRKVYYYGFLDRFTNFSPFSGSKTVDQLDLSRTSKGGNLSDGSSLSFKTELSGKEMTCDITADLQQPPTQ